MKMVPLSRIFVKPPAHITVGTAIHEAIIIEVIDFEAWLESKDDSTLEEWKARVHGKD